MAVRIHTKISFSSEGASLPDNKLVGPLAPLGLVHNKHKTVQFISDMCGQMRHSGKIMSMEENK